MLQTAARPGRAWEDESTFRLLGPLVVRTDSGTMTIHGLRQRVILVSLLLDPNTPVSAERLIDTVWADQPPRTAIAQVQNSISALRRMLSRADGEVAIVLRHSSYVLEVDERRIDVQAFLAATEQARLQRRRGAPSHAAAALSRALRLWRGEVFEDTQNEALRARALHLTQLRASAIQQYAELELSAGNHQAAIAELSRWLPHHPTDEQLCGQLMQALSQAGRPADALDLFEQLRLRLASELGVRPGDNLRALRTSLLSQRRPERRDPRADLDRPDHEEQARRLLLDAANLLATAIRLLSPGPEDAVTPIYQSANRATAVHALSARRAG